MTDAELLAGYFRRLWPIMRSITGDGVRESMAILNELVPLQISEVPSGTSVLDWTVPPEWRFRSARLLGPDGAVIADAADHTLHLLNYSEPFRGVVTLEQLNEHLYSIPEMPDAIPYVTSYYKRRWGFCISDRVRQSLPEGDYRVEIDTELFDGSLTYAESVLAGESEEEILISTYTCHPSMANNELSGPLVAALLYRRLAAMKHRRYTYRFVFIPETIGSIAYLAQNGDRMRERTVGGFVVTCVGDDAPFTLKQSRRGDSIADRAARLCLQSEYPDHHRVLPFFPDRGSDERQYCSPGFNLPIASITRSMYGEYDAYHTSEDDIDFVSFDAMVASAELYHSIVGAMDANRRFRSTQPYGEPMLSPRNLYPDTGGAKSKAKALSALMWTLNYSDGDHDLLHIAELSGHAPQDIVAAAERAEKAGVLVPV